ncbi:MAG: glycosyltransferase family 39 protein [Candidatus Altiarchaeota archaeon]
MRKEHGILVILALALALRLYFFLGLNLNDDLVYVNFAHQIAEGKFRLQSYIFSVRLLMNYPIGLFFILFGANDYSAAAYILLTSMGSIVVAYYLGKVLFNENVGLVAALLMSFFPIEVAYATTIVPDVPVAFYMGLSVLLFILAERKDDIRYAYLAGVMIGFGGLVKNLSYVIFAFLGSYFVFRSLFYSKAIKGKKAVGGRLVGGRVRFSKTSERAGYILLCMTLTLVLAVSLFPDYVQSVRLTDWLTLKSYEREDDGALSPVSAGPTEGVAKIDAFITNRNIYWDAETNSYSNRKTRGHGGKILEDLEYNLHGNLYLHALREDVNLLAKVQKPFEQADCRVENYTGAYADLEVGDVICLNTLEGNFTRLEVIEFDKDQVSLRYEFQ